MKMAITKLGGFEVNDEKHTSCSAEGNCGCLTIIDAPGPA